MFVVDSIINTDSYLANSTSLTGTTFAIIKVLYLAIN